MAKNADICNRMEWAVKVMILRQNKKKIALMNAQCYGVKHLYIEIGTGLTRWTLKYIAIVNTTVTCNTYISCVNRSNKKNSK